MKNNYKTITSICLFLAVLGFINTYAATETIAVKGSGGMANYIHTNDSKIQESTGQTNLEISEKNGKYFWANNQNKPLIKIEKEGKTDWGKTARYTIFLNPDGEGQIIVRHDPTFEEDPTISCDQGIDNYYEYRLNEYGRFIAYSGMTTPYPYPKPHKDINACKGFHHIKK